MHDKISIQSAGRDKEKIYKKKKKKTCSIGREMGDGIDRITVYTAHARILGVINLENTEER